MHGSKRSEVKIRFLHHLDCFEVLHSDALVVLGAAGVDSAVGGEVGGEGVVQPLRRLGGDGIEVGIEENRGKGRV